jgi:transposase-like protein
VVLEGFRHEVPVSELCRREGIKPNIYYAWLKDPPQAGRQVEAAGRHGAGRHTGRGRRRRENEQLKQLVAGALAGGASAIVDPDDAKEWPT